MNLYLNKDILSVVKAYLVADLCRLFSIPTVVNKADARALVGNVRGVCRLWHEVFTDLCSKGRELFDRNIFYIYRLTRTLLPRYEHTNSRSTYEVTRYYNRYVQQSASAIKQNSMYKSDGRKVVLSGRGELFQKCKSYVHNECKIIIFSKDYILRIKFDIYTVPIYSTTCFIIYNRANGKSNTGITIKFEDIDRKITSQFKSQLAKDIIDTLTTRIELNNYNGYFKIGKNYMIHFIPIDIIRAWSNIIDSYCDT